jgi:hypothetical protein
MHQFVLAGDAVVYAPFSQVHIDFEGRGTLKTAGAQGLNVIRAKGLLVSTRSATRRPYVSIGEAVPRKT